VCGVSESDTTPNRWIPVLSDETVMVLINDEYIQDPNPDDLDGIGGSHHLTFRATDVGVCSVDIYLVRVGD